MPLLSISLCESLKITINKQSFNGNRNLKLIEWKYKTSSDTDENRLSEIKKMVESNNLEIEKNRYLFA